MTSTTTEIDPTSLPPPSHQEAMALATTEADRLLAVVDRLDPDDWTRPTDCTGWDVKALLSHML
ncbi:MAG TPA: maleylpyruvate isomerase N-terminal domain-containing protein, partial [Acidimicrobiales bacterium]|nr:maleylpyruvate isomerase N-terminal domain-containing protein [Acidimicrobiales bacterium]